MTYIHLLSCSDGSSLDDVGMLSGDVGCPLQQHLVQLCPLSQHTHVLCLWPPVPTGCDNHTAAPLEMQESQHQCDSALNCTEFCMNSLYSSPLTALTTCTGCVLWNSSLLLQPQRCKVVKNHQIITFPITFQMLTFPVDTFP